MSDYFYAPLIRDNPVEVEHLYSYIGGLARIHGVTVHQFLRHIDCYRQGLTGDYRRVLPRIFEEPGTALCSYGADVKDVVDSLKVAVGESDLQISTFLALRNALSRRAQGLLKRNRAWCPACFAEAIRDGLPVYERLYWISSHCYRCIFHNIRLLDQCPHCKSYQRNYSIRWSAADCDNCHHSLIGEPEYWIHDNKPGWGEKQIIELIEYMANNPSVSFQTNAVDVFDSEIQRYHYGLFGDPLIIKRAISPEPAPFHIINSALQRSLGCDVSLVLILVDPKLAARIAISPLSPTPVLKNPRPRHTRSVLAKLKAALIKAIKNDSLSDKPTALKRICCNLGVSTGYAYYHFRELCRELSINNALYKYEGHAKERLLIRERIRDELYPRYQNGSIRSHDELVFILVSGNGTTYHAAREELRLHIQAIRTTKSRIGSGPTTNGRPLYRRFKTEEELSLEKLHKQGGTMDVAAILNKPYW